ncbi:MAG: chorismate mutase [Acidimicrobiia bacterium]
MRIRALRGAITCDEDSVAEIETKTQRLILEMLARNSVEHDDVVSVIFTSTDDLRAAFPATAARGVGFGDVPMLCAGEVDVEGSLARVVRVMMHVYTERESAELVHVYLDGAQVLRADIAQ